MSSTNEQSENVTVEEVPLCNTETTSNVDKPETTPSVKPKRKISAGWAIFASFLIVYFIFSVCFTYGYFGDILTIARPFGMDQLELLFYLYHFMFLPSMKWNSKQKKEVSTKASDAKNERPKRSKMFRFVKGVTILVLIAALICIAIVGNLASSFAVSFLYAMMFLPSVTRDTMHHNAWEIFKGHRDQLTCRCSCENVVRSKLGYKLESMLCYSDTNLSVASFSIYNRINVFITINMGIMLLKVAIDSIVNGLKGRKLHKGEGSTAEGDIEKQPLIDLDEKALIDIEN